MNTLVTKVVDGVYYIGVNDRETALFENMWPLPKGVAYNSYVIIDEKTALMDTVKAMSTEEFLDRLEIALDGRPLDYLVVHHMEPDHSGSIRSTIAKYPDVKNSRKQKNKRNVATVL